VLSALKLPTRSIHTDSQAARIRVTGRMLHSAQSCMLPVIKTRPSRGADHVSWQNVKRESTTGASCVGVLCTHSAHMLQQIACPTALPA